MATTARARDDDDDARVGDRRTLDDASVARALRAATTREGRANDARGARRRRAAERAREEPVAVPSTTPRGRASETWPMDWSLKASARWTSETSMRWIASVGACTMSEGVRAYSNGSTMTTVREDDVAAKQRAMTRATYSCAFPGETMSGEQCALMRASASGIEWMKQREAIWNEALVSLYGLLRVRQCYAFYVVYRERTVLFCAPGVGGVEDGGYAVVTQSNAKFRRALTDAAVVFTSADAEAAAIDQAKKDYSRTWRPEDEARGGLLDELEGGGASRAMDNTEVTAQLAKMDAPSAARRKAADTIICRGAIAVHGLLSVLMEASGADPGSLDGGPQDVPLLLAPVPFAHSSLKPLSLKIQSNNAVIRQEARDTARTLQVFPHTSTAAAMRATYTAETARNELIPPWTLARVCAALTLNHEEYSLSCTSVPHTCGLNVGVLAARNMSEQSSRREVELIRERDYYDDAETFRIAAAPQLESSIITRAEYVNKTYYVS